MKVCLKIAVQKASIGLFNDSDVRRLWNPMSPIGLMD